MSTFTIADSFDATDRPRNNRANGTDLSAPLPLGYSMALERAAQMRNAHPAYTWTAIAQVMSDYHGFRRSPDWWRRELQGRVPCRAHGGSFTKESRARLRMMS